MLQLNYEDEFQNYAQALVDNAEKLNKSISSATLDNIFSAPFEGSTEKLKEFNDALVSKMNVLLSAAQNDPDVNADALQETLLHKGRELMQMYYRKIML
jgi:hypothetical protein